MIKMKPLVLKLKRNTVINIFTLLEFLQLAKQLKRTHHIQIELSLQYQNRIKSYDAGLADCKITDRASVLDILINYSEDAVSDKQHTRIVDYCNMSEVDVNITKVPRKLRELAHLLRAWYRDE